VVLGAIGGGFALHVRLLQPRCFPACDSACSAAKRSQPPTRKTGRKQLNSIVENLYGPTETTIAISHYRWYPSKSPQECLNGIVPIGWPFAGQQCCVVDHERGEVSETGELCLAGSQVTDGYWTTLRKPRVSSSFPRNRRDSLVPHRGPGEARENGCLYYLGRIDHQVKIRGYRVELQEIEVVLRKTSKAEQVVAVPWPVAYGSADGVVAFVSGGSKPR